MLGNKMGVDSS